MCVIGLYRHVGYHLEAILAQKSRCKLQECPGSFSTVDSTQQARAPSLSFVQRTRWRERKNSRHRAHTYCLITIDPNDERLAGEFLREYRPVVG